MELKHCQLNRQSLLNGLMKIVVEGANQRIRSKVAMLLVEWMGKALEKEIEAVDFELLCKVIQVAVQ